MRDGGRLKEGRGTLKEGRGTPLRLPFGFAQGERSGTGKKDERWWSSGAETTNWKERKGEEERDKDYPDRFSSNLLGVIKTFKA